MNSGPPERRVLRRNRPRHFDTAGQQRASAGDHVVHHRAERAVAVAAHRIVAAGAEQQGVGHADHGFREHLAGLDARGRVPVPAERAVPGEAAIQARERAALCGRVAEHRLRAAAIAERCLQRKRVAARGQQHVVEVAPDPVVVGGHRVGAAGQRGAVERARGSARRSTGARSAANPACGRPAPTTR